MKAKHKKFDYVQVTKYALLFCFFLVFNSLEKTVMPYSLSILAVALTESFSIIISPLLFLLSLIVLGGSGFLLAGGISSALLVMIMLIYKSFYRTPKFEVCAYLVAALVAFIFIGDTTKQVSLEKRVFCSIISVALCFFLMIANKAVTKKGLKFKLGFEEILSIALIVAVFGVGVCNLTTPSVWKVISIFIILTVCYLYRTGIATIVSAVLGISLSVYFLDINFISLYLLTAIVAECLSPISRYLSAIAMPICDYVIEILFGVYGGYTLAEFLPALIGVGLFCLIPTKPLASVKERLYSFREKQLVRQSINRNRVALSGRLYDLSAVFSEMASAFNSFNNNFPSEDKSKELIEKQLRDLVCKECAHNSRCKKYNDSLKIGFYKLVDIGFAKGRISLIDLPKEIGDVCFHPNDIIFSVNKSLADYRAIMLDRINIKNGRDLLASEAIGISEILRGLALETGTLIKYHTRLERALSTALFKKGYLIEELLVYGEAERISVSMVVVMKEFSIDGISATVSKSLNADMIITEKTEISPDKCFLFLKKSPLYDVVFGLSSAVKDNSATSGDTHSVLRLNNNKFMLALSDGMGSGKTANDISSASLSLIESFYKAGLSSELILNTVNKLLAINTEDSFTALDVAIIDLNNCAADFIKYGSPYGFIIGKSGIKIVEGNTLPLGIIDELKPSICSTCLEAGNMVVLVSDGISDSFDSSSAFIDFLREMPSKNPQTLADEILKKAISLSSGEKRDDMTVLAVRLYKRKLD